MLQKHTIEPSTYELLESLSKFDMLKDTRLVGGTALALQYGHRNSVDLDFFGKLDCEVDDLTIELKKLGDVKRISQSKNIRAYIINGIKVDIVNYSYEWIDNPIIEEGIVLASDKDIAAMKINAVMGRGTKKDFIDIFALLENYSLNDLLDFYSAKYPDGSLFRALLSLNYFDDADPQPSPKLFISSTWEEIRESIKQAIIEFNSH